MKRQRQTNSNHASGYKAFAAAAETEKKTHSVGGGVARDEGSDAKGASGGETVAVAGAGAGAAGEGHADAIAASTVDAENDASAAAEVGACAEAETSFRSSCCWCKYCSGS